MTEIVVNDLIMLSGKEDQREPAPIVAESTKRRVPASEEFDDALF